jgi:hypothetical protein
MRVIDVSTPLLDEFPALRNPAAPSFDVSREAALERCADFAETLRFDDELVMREPVGEVVVVPAEGDCLAPAVPAGRHYWHVDPSLPAQVCDFVLLEAGPRCLAYIEFFAEGDPEWSAKYKSIPNTWIKQIRELDGAIVTCSNGSCLPIWDCRILGVCTRWTC